MTDEIANQTQLIMPIIESNIIDTINFEEIKSMTIEVGEMTFFCDRKLSIK